MLFRNLLNSLKTFCAARSYENEEIYFQASLDYDGTEEEPEENNIELGEFECTVSVLFYEGLVYEVDVDHQELLKADSFEEVVEILSARYSYGFSWSVSARDWIDAEYSHRHTLSEVAVDAQHYAQEAQQMERCGCRDAEERAF